MLLLFLHIEYLQIKEVAESLGLKDSRSAKNWLRDNNIPISNIGNKDVVHKFLFEFKQQQIIVKELRTCYPNNWFEIYDAKTDDKAMVKAIQELYPNIKKAKINRNHIDNKYIK
ncbi:hypothetical protein [uncultured Winogradskyella sp.]|uniref:hypothetical protein n=1 Tax=uncultured Winogradskyella sp. TaxID=395353 RepID=UPI0026119F99|nr:hypothetical protein [uncultured Winogradskyella sp.]